jgi:hypothetical protein
VSAPVENVVVIMPLDDVIARIEAVADRLDDGDPAADVVADAEAVVDAVRALDLREADPFAVNHLLGAALEVETSFRPRPSDTPASLRLGLETMRQSLERLRENQGVSDLRPLREVVDDLMRVMHTNQVGLAKLLEVSPGTVRRWLVDKRDVWNETEEMLRARTLAQVVNQLRHVLTARGVVAWLRTPHPELKAPPLSLLGEERAVPRLVGLAARGRSQVAS